jgi:tetratricopeptide (TPR) repeat protein
MGTLDRVPPPEYKDRKVDGDTRLEAGAFADARVLLEEALEALENYYRAERELISDRLAQARRGLVDQHLEAAMEAVESGNSERAEEAFGSAMEAAPDSTARDRVRLTRLESTGDGDDGDTGLSEHLQNLYEQTLSAPEDPTLHYNFGIELALDGYLDAAAGQLARAVELTEDDGEARAIALFRLGNVYFDLERGEEALEAYGQALELGYDPADVHYRIGTVFEWGNDHEQALEHFNASLEANPEHVACLGYERLAGIDPEDDENMLRIGALRQDSGDAEGAIEAFERVLELDPEGEFAEDAEAALEELRG